jgi:hypothetical protein
MGTLELVFGLLLCSAAAAVLAADKPPRRPCLPVSDLPSCTCMYAQYAQQTDCKLNAGAHNLSHILIN